MARVIVSGSVAYDRIMDFDGLFAEHFVPDKLHSINLSFQIKQLSVGFGGTAGNIAYNLALLSVQSDIIATVGEDFSSYRSHMLLSGIVPNSIRTLEGEMTSSAYVFTDKADNQIAAFHMGAGGYSYDSPVDTEGRDLAIVAPGCIEDMKNLPELYRKRGFSFLYDPAQALTALSGEDLRAGMTGAKVLFGSDYEFGLMAQKTGWIENAMLERVPTLVITLGAEGARVVTREGEVRVKATPVKDSSDPTGAGDAFRAGFIKGMLTGMSLESCAKLASTVAAYTVEAYGTQTHKFTLDELKARFKGAYGESLAL
ncbi:hypothetical protein A3A39_04040 [Candidatus Kaiserbacteria bacterium RIFCSPLOWO2_01_FULL_54_13]|uniref:Carbohydrate kinase PfkB domain-containing protein n=1 Tax=Candidatus Kaiserbacteria bacterium RIFCSPLOWO2_01_FULL_54_13 TaxID=1798512 RepID=A0A1F6F456_9BACT|nr:MAG: hypothetical protein A3A39_04040 [Candidatus Kaiserbacteria bacterium RIFCSPLOWO2_01_FULL_54_13]